MDTIPPLSLPILLDGATGSELYKRGMPAGAYTEQWVLGHPEALLELQRGYVAAGSQVLIAPTFGANRVRLEQHGIFGQVADYNRRLVELSRQAAGGRALVAGDMAPTGLFIAPFGESSFEELVAIYTEQAAALAAAGVDLFLIETTMTMPEARAAVLACKSVSDRPVWVTFTCDENGRTLSGTDVLAAVAVLQRIGVSTIILTAEESQDLTDALRIIAPYARVSLGVRCPAVWLLRDMELPNVELFVPLPHERARRLADLVRTRPHGRTVIPREVDDVALVSDGRDAHFIDWTTGISDEIPCDHELDERLIELEDEAPAAFKLLIEEEEDVITLEENLYMITRPVCLCAQSPELLEKALRVYAGLALYDGTWEQEERILKYFTEKYGLICM